MMDLLEGLQQTEMTRYLSGLAGQVSGMIIKVKSAVEVMEDIVSEAVDILEKKMPAEVRISQ